MKGRENFNLQCTGIGDLIEVARGQILTLRILTHNGITIIILTNNV
jgi:hypothetical protein